MPSDAPNAFTVDLEDWYQGLEIDLDDWGGYAPRIEVGLRALLGLLDEAGVRATFFVLGHQAKKTPALIREVAARGHEIASHGWSHRFVYRIGPDAFRRELRDSKALLEDVAQSPVQGYRAPFFSITNESLWALDILLEEGYRYDSSVFPVFNYRYGIPGAARTPGPIATPSGATILEVPLSTVRAPLGLNIPISGGGYFRLYPYAVTRALVRTLLREGLGLVFYVHPWEYDTHHPRVKMPRFVPQLTHYHNLPSMIGKTRKLLADFPFAPIRDAYRAELAR
jgi:polysaccharide deacetylase family protein (PEP-CTERM system associated)